MLDDRVISGPGFAERRRWFLRGALVTFSLPGLMLASGLIGFGGLAREAGLTLGETVFMTAIVWALPGQVVLVGTILSGVTLPAAAFAVALSSVRLMPMVVTLTPQLRGRRTPQWVLYGLSHFIAVTAWVVATEHFSNIPRDMRTTWYFGFCATVALSGTCLVAVIYLLAGAMPPIVAAALFFITPIYFLTSLWGSARELTGKMALVLGMVCGPVFHLLAPEVDLLAAGILGGGAAYLLHRWRKSGT